MKIIIYTNITKQHYILKLSPQPQEPYVFYFIIK